MGAATVTARFMPGMILVKNTVRTPIKVSETKESKVAKNQLNLKDRVITCGGSHRRVILDWEACIAYQSQDPSNVLAVYEKGKGWIVRQAPYYSSGGWGRGSSGDGDGHYLAENTRTMLKSIDARIYELNCIDFLEPKELSKLQAAITDHNKKVESHNKLRERLGTHYKMEKMESVPDFKLRLIESGVLHGPRGLDAIKTAKAYEDATQIFILGKGKVTKLDSYEIGPKLITQKIKHQDFDYDTRKYTQRVETIVVAFRDADNKVFMNSQVLHTTNFERAFLGGESMIQREIRKIATYNIPFNVLESAKLKLHQTNVIESGPPSTHKLSNGQERHFTGALLLENAGRKFLMDIDRVEIEHGIFNAFFVEVNKKVKSIEEAYDSMIPDEVKQAMADKIAVKRQGEWFFISTDMKITVKNEDFLQYDRSTERKKVILRHEIAHGKGRPNLLYKPVGFSKEVDALVCGTVSHTGREHRDLDLGRRQNDKRDQVTFDLWKVVPNTTVGNFTIKGEVD